MENRGDLIPHCMGRALLLLSKHYKNAQTLIPKHIESNQKKKKNGDSREAFYFKKHHKLHVGTNCTLCSNYVGRGQVQYLIPYIQTV